jgi:16S rRNA C967 or C1407 C5-methylase (RsmB/RsmF family)/NOL1/NOP2/fmu family ribosome biogenesis protein
MELKKHNVETKILKKYKAFLMSFYGETFTNELIDIIVETTPNISIRKNPQKIDKQIFGIDLKIKVPWSNHGNYLIHRPNFAYNPIYHAGGFYVQESHSMFLEKVIDLIFENQECKIILDLCASPGGKSTHILSLINKKCLLVSNEISSKRNFILTENLVKWGYENVVVTQNEPEDFSHLSNFFDIVLVDAPCSGEGMFRKNKNAINEWSEKIVRMCSNRQKKILNAIWPCIKRNGYLIFSTCTLNPYENEENVRWLVKNFEAEVIQLPFDKTWDVIDTGVGLLFMPSKNHGEGFFISLIQKKDGNETNYFLPQKIPLFMPELNKIKTKKETELAFFKNFDNLYAINKSHQAVAWFLKNNLKVKKLGLWIGYFTNKDFIFTHEYAVSNIINNLEFPLINVDYTQALNYLRKNEIRDQEMQFSCRTTDKNYLVQFEGLNLGFARKVDNKLKNMYPIEWRLRS